MSLKGLAFIYEVSVILCSIVATEAGVLVVFEGLFLHSNGKLVLATLHPCMSGFPQKEPVVLGSSE